MAMHKRASAGVHALMKDVDESRLSGKGGKLLLSSNNTTGGDHEDVYGYDRAR